MSVVCHVKNSIPTIRLNWVRFAVCDLVKKFEHILVFIMTPSQKVWVCLFGNSIVLCAVIVMVVLFRDNTSKYFRYGPHEDLILISVKIDTWFRWWSALGFVGIIKGCEVLVNELGSPVLSFNVYNPDKKVITDFTKNELNFITNAMWFINGLRGIMMTVLTITQFDLAFCSVIISESVSILTVRILLNEKTFAKATNSDRYVELKGEIAEQSVC